jgi:hypothetical protein
MTRNGMPFWPVVPQFVQQVKNGVGFAAAGHAGNETMFGEIGALDGKPILRRLAAVQYLADIDDRLLVSDSISSGKSTSKRA